MDKTEEFATADYEVIFTWLSKSPRFRRKPIGNLRERPDVLDYIMKRYKKRLKSLTPHKAMKDAIENALEWEYVKVCVNDRCKALFAPAPPQRSGGHRQKYCTVKCRWRFMDRRKKKRKRAKRGDIMQGKGGGTCGSKDAGAGSGGSDGEGCS